MKIHENHTDRLTNATLSMSTDHNYIHRWKAFTLSGKSGSVAAGASTTISFRTPATKYAHWRPAVWSSTANLGELRIAQGSTFSGGSAATAYNRNHNATTTSGVVIKTGVTLTVEGTVKYYGTVGTGGTPTTRSGGGGGENHELVLKPDTEYTLTFSNIGSATATVFYWQLFWYEEDEGVV